MLEGDASTLLVASISAGSALLGGLIGAGATLVHGWLAFRRERKTKAADHLKTLYLAFLGSSRRYMQAVWNAKCGVDDEAEQRWARSFDEVEDQAAHIAMLERSEDARSLVRQILKAAQLEGLVRHPRAQFSTEAHAAFYGPQEQLLDILRRRYGFD